MLLYLSIFINLRAMFAFYLGYTVGFSLSKSIKSALFFNLHNDYSSPSPVTKKQLSGDVLKIFAKFTVIQLCQSLIFDKVAVLRPGTLLKQRLRHRCFPVNFAKYLRKPFYIEHLRCLLLCISMNYILILG